MVMVMAYIHIVIIMTRTASIHATNDLSMTLQVESIGAAVAACTMLSPASPVDTSSLGVSVNRIVMAMAMASTKGMLPNGRKGAAKPHCLKMRPPKDGPRTQPGVCQRYIGVSASSVVPSKVHSCVSVS